jgi:hypothetical protein
MRVLVSVGMRSNLGAETIVANTDRV